MRSRGIHGEIVSFNKESFRIELSPNLGGGGGTLYFFGKGPRGKEHEFIGTLTKSELNELAEMCSEIAERARKLNAKYARPN